MTQEVMRRLLAEELEFLQLEEVLKAVIRERLDYEEIANLIWDEYGDQLTAEAAQMAAENLLPF